MKTKKVPNRIYSPEHDHFGRLWENKYRKKMTADQSNLWSVKILFSFFLHFELQLTDNTIWRLSPFSQQQACVETSDLFLSCQHAWRLRSAPRTSEASCSVNQRLWYHVERANMTVLISSNVVDLWSFVLMDEAEVLFWTRSRDYQLMFFYCWQIVGHDLFSLLEEMS